MKKSGKMEIGLTDDEVKNLIQLAKCARKLKPMQKLRIASEAQELVKRAHKGKKSSEIQKLAEKCRRMALVT